MQTARFAHHSLRAYPVILEALVRGDAVAKKVPRGYAKLADQMRRALLGCVSPVRRGRGSRGRRPEGTATVRTGGSRRGSRGARGSTGAGLGCTGRARAHHRAARWLLRDGHGPRATQSAPEPRAGGAGLPRRPQRLLVPLARRSAGPEPPSAAPIPDRAPDPDPARGQRDDPESEQREDRTSHARGEGIPQFEPKSGTKMRMSTTLSTV